MKKNPYYFDLVCCVMKKYLSSNIKKIFLRNEKHFQQSKNDFKYTAR